MTELFGPVLGVMRAKDLEQAIELVNETGYGLTSGLESLDDREQSEWRERIRAGNQYINRVTTGAIVQRQPFGGMGKSAFGPGIKAGGPNYVAQLMHFEPAGVPAGSATVENPSLAGLLDALTTPDDFTAERINANDRKAICDAIRSYDANFREEFGREHDPNRLIGQDNIFRYLPVNDVRLRVHAADTAFDVFARAAAAHAAGARTTVSIAPGGRSPVIEALEHVTRSASNLQLHWRAVKRHLQRL